MLVECMQCDIVFEVEKSVAFVFDPESENIYLLCSEKCIKNYIEELPRVYRIKIEKGGDK